MNVETLWRMFSPYLNQNSRIQTSNIDKLFSNTYAGAGSYDNDDIENDTSVLTDALANVYYNTILTKTELYHTIDQVKNIDLAQIAIDTMIDDAFNSVDTDEPFVFTYEGNEYDNAYIMDEIDEFIEKFNIHQLFWDILPEFGEYGERYLETIPEIGKGIVEINDTVDAVNIFSLYRNYDLIEHIGFVNSTSFAGTRYSMPTSTPIRIHKDLLSHFVLDARKVRININNNNRAAITSMPDIIRLGRSILYPSIQLLKRSNIMDIAITAKELRNALTPTIISMGMPNVTSPGELINACKKLEKYFMDSSGLNNLINDDELSVSSLFSKTGNLKVAPNMQGGKAEISKLDIDTNIESVQNVKNDIDSRIKDVLGLMKDDQNVSRFTLLKNKSKYSKKLIDFQRCTGKGLTDMLYKHFRYKKIYIDRSKLSCKFKSILNADVFEEAEGIISLISVLSDLNTFVQSMVDNEQLDIGVRSEAMIKTFDQLLGSRYVSLDRMLYVKSKEKSVL